jgi:small subunit ribosomal protein S16
MLKLRLSMGGAKKRPIYKIVVADSRFPRDGRFIEKLGFFNPLLPKNKKERIGIEEKRVKHWLSKGAQPTIRVARILGELGMMSMPVQGNNPQKAIPKKDRKKETKTEAPKTEAPKTEAKTEALKTEAKKAAPKTEAKTEAPKTEAKTEAPKTEAPKTEAKKATPKTEAPKTEKTKK